MRYTFLEKVENIRKRNWRARARLEIYLKKDKKIVLVEGELDKKIYSDIAYRNGLDIEFIVIGSKLNYLALKDTINDKWIFSLLDRDDDVPTIDDTVMTTECYSIENYILFNDYWKFLIPKELQGKFLGAVNVTNCHMNFIDLKTEIINKCNDPNIIERDANYFVDRKIKNTIIKAIRAVNGSGSFYDVIRKNNYELFLKNVNTNKLKGFLNKV